MVPNYKPIESLYSIAYTPLHSPRKYFAFVESVENYFEKDSAEGKIFVRFDCLRIDDGQYLSQSESLNLGQLSEIPFIHIECIFLPFEWEKHFKEYSFLELENQWLLVETHNLDGEGVVVEEFYNGGEPYQMKIVRLKPTPEEENILNGLARKFDLINLPQSSKQDIENRLSGRFLNFDSIIISNVGQGNLNFLTFNDFPVIYFDLGGGTGKHSFTYPQIETIVTCKTQNPTVILSHWDMDHIETAIRDTSNCNLDWVVPLQKVGKTHYTLALRINSNGKLLIWPNNLSLLSFAGGDIIKCNGTSKNDSGLALVIKSNNVGQSLLPGDAQYGCIPRLSAYVLSCLVVSHHGSNSAQSNVPMANGNKWIAYSFGSNNWGHPTTNTRNAHQHQQWNIVRETINGSIVFDKKNYTSPCGNGQCNLFADQYF